MRSRTVREGSVGLFILLGVGLCLSVILWLRGWQLGSRTYRVKVELADALGINVGSAVRFRGVQVGNVTAVEPSTNGVTVEAEIESAELLIPRNVTVEASQSGFIGQVTLDFQPQSPNAAVPVVEGLSPFEPDCNPELILCSGDQLKGQVGVNFNELIRATTQIALLLSDTEVITNANTALKNVSAAAVSFNQLSKKANPALTNLSNAALGVNQLSQEARQQLGSIGVAANSVTRAANQVGSLGSQFNTTASRLNTVAGEFSTTASRINNAADQVGSLVQTNRGTLVATLANLNEASQELKVAVKGLSPVISRVEKGKLLDNLEILAANGAEASTNLRDLSATLNNPVTLLGLAQTLDSARVTFQNTQKITTDLDQLTGDPTVRENLIKLINGLSKLVSSSQDLERQLQAVRQSPPNSLATEPQPHLKQPSQSSR